MSGGSPGGGYVRQRHSQGYASSGDEFDLDDDGCSRLQVQVQLHHPSSFSIPTQPKTWTELLEISLWILSALFVLYFGDSHSNFIYLLCHDHRIRRTPLYLGLVGIVLNIIIFFYTRMLASSVRRSDEKWEMFSIHALPFMTLLALLSFCLLCFALWPIWSFLTLPLMFTLFMVCVVLFPYTMIGSFKPQNDSFRTD